MFKKVAHHINESSEHQNTNHATCLVKNNSTHMNKEKNVAAFHLDINNDFKGNNYNEMICDLNSTNN